MKKRVGTPYLIWHWQTVEITDEEIDDHQGEVDEAAIDACARLPKPFESLGGTIACRNPKDRLELVSEVYDDQEPQVEDV